MLAHEDQSDGCFLGSWLSNHLKIKVIQDIKSSSNINEVQRLIGKIVSLDRFISKLVEKNLPFFKVLRKAKELKWSEEFWCFFEALEQYFAELPLPVKSLPRDTLYLYLFDTSQAISSTLLLEKKGTSTPIHYVIKTTIKAQALADFMSKITVTTLSKRVYQQDMDGSTTLSESGVGIVRTSHEGGDLESSVRFDFKGLKNEKEYRALTLGMKIA
ncbi:UNVERIFIED_CONTAM: hypothetical protein Scaly_0051300 [Sesamum calycinum]|uniref:Reverse transcriptase/retrotransposon-derived protein RNase H-like domain-containing protein n=1 Tax=Sesamum calycinum TaxID=2727403 RepID=A0AAW2SUP8_9LAMI